jgi:hypothetical protein
MEGLSDQGLRILEALRARHDGTRRNPYNEIECGDHYARAMAGWSVLEAISGFRYDALRARLSVGGKPGRFPFVAGTGWGQITVTPDDVEIGLLGGELALADVVVGGESRRVDLRLAAGQPASLPRG